MPPACLNCQQSLPASALFCPHCGQKTSTRRLSLHDIVHDAWHALTHTDHSVLALVAALLRRPGRVAAEYVAGRRKTWFNPFSFLIVVVGLASLAMAGSGFVNFVRPGMDNAATRFLQSHLNLLILLQVPLLAGFGRLLFARRGHNFAEWLVLAAYSSGLRSIFFTLGVAPLWWGLRQAGLAPSYPAALGLYLVVWLLYFSWATAQFLEPQWRWPLLLRALAVPLLSQLATIVLVSLLITLPQLRI